MNKPTYSSEELDVLSRRINHDFQRDIGNISGLVRLLKINYKEELDTSFQEYLSHIDKSSQNLKNSLSFLNKVFDIHREFLPRETSICSVLKNLLENNLSDLVSDKNVEVMKGDQLGSFLGKSCHFKELLKSLIENSIIYNTSTKPFVHISSSTENGEVTLRVKDNGVGFPENFTFDYKFYCKTNYELNKVARGMGLALCSKIMSIYEGSLSFERDANGGTIAICVFPAKFFNKANDEEIA